MLQTSSPNLPIFETMAPMPETIKYRPLSDKDLKLKSKYLETKNPVKSAIYAGYAESTAKARAYGWVADLSEKNPKRPLALEIQAEILKQTQRDTDNDNLIDDSWHLNKAVIQYRKASGDIPTHTTKKIDPDTGDSINIEHFKYDAANANKALEMIGKHRKVKAFDTTVQIEAGNILSDLIKNLPSSLGPPRLLRNNPVIVDAEIIEDKLIAPIKEPLEPPC